MKPDSLFFSDSLHALKQSPLFKNLTDTKLTEILISFRRMTWTKNAAAITSSQTMDYFYVIISGRLKVSKINPDTGRELTFFLLGPGDAFDVICLLDECEHPVQVTVLDNMEALYAPMDDIRHWIETHTDFNKTLLPYLGEQMRRMEDLATDLAIRDTATRLARLILHHTIPDPSVDKRFYPVQLIHDLTNDSLAQMIGSTRQVVNQHLQALRRKGILGSKSRHLAVLELETLKEKAEEFLSRGHRD